MRSGFTRWWPRIRASLRVRVAIAAAIAAGVVVAALMVLASIALAGNDAEQKVPALTQGERAALQSERDVPARIPRRAA